MVNPIDDIISTGFLFGVFDNENQIVSIAGPAHLPYKQQFEVQLVTVKSHRRRGFATWVSASLLSYSLQQDYIPVWDAENSESSHLAEKLGYEKIYEYAMIVPTNNLIRIVLALRIHKVIQLIFNIRNKMKRRQS